MLIFNLAIYTNTCSGTIHDPDEVRHSHMTGKKIIMRETQNYI